MKTFRCVTINVLVACIFLFADGHCDDEGPSITEVLITIASDSGAAFDGDR